MRNKARHSTVNSVLRILSGLLAGHGITRMALGLVLSFTPGILTAQTQQKGDASLRVEYQFIGTGDYNTDGFIADYWTTDSHVLLLSGDYALNERWTVYAALPYVQKRFVPDPNDPFGGDPHNPNDYYWIDYVPEDKRFIDDGDYHGGLQDLSLGMMYRWVDGVAWTVSPYIGYAVPASDYPFFAKAAIGLNLWNVPVGVDLGFTPYFSDWHFRGNLAYVFSEEVLDINVDYWLAYVSAGYWFKPNFSVDVFLSSKYVRDALILLWDFTDETDIESVFATYPDEWDTAEWYNHDRIIQHRILNLGVSFDYFFNEKYQLSGTYFQSLWADQTNEVDNAFSIALTRYFGGN